MDRDLMLIFGFTTLIVLIIAGTIIVYPLTRRLAEAAERYLGTRTEDEDLRRELAGVRDVVGSMDQRLALLEDRLEFTESLVEQGAPRRERLARGPAGEPSPEDAGRPATASRE